MTEFKDERIPIVVTQTPYENVDRCSDGFVMETLRVYIPPLISGTTSIEYRPGNIDCRIVNSHDYFDDAAVTVHDTFSV